MSTNSLIFMYSITSVAVCLFLIWLTVRVLKSSLDIKLYLALPMIMGFFSIISYIIFINSYGYKTALFFNSLYFIGTDWMAFFMFRFSLAYSGTKKKFKFLSFIFTVFCITDSVSLLLNFKHLHSFDLVQTFLSSGFSYWGLEFTTLHYFHLGFCYVMVGLTFVHLFVNALLAPTYYKNKFVTILFAYGTVIICNFISYTLNTPVDFSVVLYGILAGFICTYSSKQFPAYLVNSSLVNLNNTISSAIFCFDFSGKLILKNAAARQLMEKSIGNDSDAETFRRIFLETKPKEITLSINNKPHHFRTEYNELSIEGAFTGSYLKLEDKTNEINQLKNRRYMVTHDSLTGLLNRAGFFETVQHALEHYSYINPIMLASNIKDFKLINEIYGEKTGDNILINQANMMINYAHRKNINGRLNDDKFAILMEKKDFNHEIFEEAFQLLNTITEDNIYHMKISVGIYEILDKKESVQSIYDKAKMAMDSIGDDYQSMFAYYDSTMMDRLMAEKNVVSEFEKALEEMQFELYLQPVTNEKGTLCSAEALVRWNHPRDRIITPVNFIDILERTGLIYKMDQYVWDMAAKKAKEWQTRGITDIPISINISSKDKYYIDIAQVLLSITSKYNLDPSCLILEIREKSLMESREKTMEMFNALKDAGFKIIIDRFGTGYTSLNMLKDYNADGVKIDTDFLSNDHISEKNRIILTTMIELADSLNMQIIAEGVETKNNVITLSEMGCRLFQGYYFSKPLPVREFESLYLKKK